MKLLFVHDHKFRKYGSDYYSSGGLDNKALEFYAKLADKVTVVAREIIVSKEEAIKLSKITINNIEIQTVKDFFDKKSVKKIFNINTFESDCIIARLPSVLGNEAVRFSKVHNIPLLIESVACPWDGLWNHSFKGKLIAPYMYFKTKKNIKNATHVLYVTNEFLQKRYPTKGDSINCSDVALQPIDELILKKRIEKITKKHTLKIVVGTLAAVDVKYKGQSYVIRAISKLKNVSNTEVEYQLVGAGDNIYLKKIAEKYGVLENMKFIGSIPHDQIFNWLDTIDLYIQPSRLEGLPRALIEAMSRGCPALGSKTGGIPELLDETCIFEKGNIKQITEKIQEIITQEKMIFYAQVNFERSKKYEKERLEKKRIEFYNKFKLYAEKL